MFGGELAMKATYREYEMETSKVPGARSEPRHGIHGYRAVGKRLLDIAFVLLALPAAAPIIAIAALIVMLDGANPFYLQKRVGAANRIFWMVKLRSMVPNAEERLGLHLSENPAAKAEWDDKQKLSNDPRITAVGHFIRKFSIDELPQLWNVLCGDMSLVGPRPMLPEQRVLYPGTAYYRLRPGLTGPWQISDRNDCSFAHRAVFDEQYEKSCSLKTDLMVMLSTVRVVFKGTGC
jgi:lipopolysaccharide/colanic/teichoic acid biosynthesis glycosyltransferase